MKRLKIKKKIKKKKYSPAPSSPEFDIQDSNQDNIRVLKQFSILNEFSSAIRSSYDKNGNEELTPKDLSQRKDLRHLPFVTIDGINAKDFDDSIYVEKLKKGWKAFVSIADVDHYVKEGGALDREAYQRGNSTYFPDFVSPMLPHYLSQNLCSLNPHVPRLTMTVEMHYDHKTQLKKSFFYESVICSHARLTYEHAQAIIEGERAKKVSKAIQSSLLAAKDLTEILMNQRINNGSINLELPETEIFLDEEGSPINIVRSHRLFSHKLIEELMLATNQAIANFLSRKKISSIYRIHETPNREDLSHLDKFLKALGLSASLMGKQNSHLKKSKISNNIPQCIEKMKGHPKKVIMHNLILRALPQARYSAYNKGHFGLQFDYYTHFTSPIRRYSDLIVHRLLKRTLKISKGSLSSTKELERKAILLSQCEQKSVQAERRITSIKKARFMQKHLGGEFKGMVSTVTKFGFFVTLYDHYVDGLVHINNLGGRWKFNPSQLFLKSFPSGYSIHQGDNVTIQVAVCNVEEGFIDFDLLEHNQKKYYQREISLKKLKPKKEKKSHRKSHYRYN